MRYAFVTDERFAIVRFSGPWCSVFRVEGFRYDAETDTSAPVVSTRAFGGATTFRGELVRRLSDAPAFGGLLWERWPGIEYGRDVDRSTVPRELVEWGERTERAWLDSLAHDERIGTDGTPT